jgi:hypothetical protein
MEVLTKKSRPFRKVETYKHRYAVEVLASWVKGETERPFFLDGIMTFVPDVTVYKDGILNCVYEVVNKNPINGKKLGLMQYYCYRMSQELTVFEVSAEYIMTRVEQPEVIETMSCYIIDPFENESN